MLLKTSSFASTASGLGDSASRRSLDSVSGSGTGAGGGAGAGAGGRPGGSGRLFLLAGSTAPPKLLRVARAAGSAERACSPWAAFSSSASACSPVALSQSDAALSVELAHCGSVYGASPRRREPLELRRRPSFCALALRPPLLGGLLCGLLCRRWRCIRAVLEHCANVPRNARSLEGVAAKRGVPEGGCSVRTAAAAALSTLPRLLGVGRLDGAAAVEEAVEWRARRGQAHAGSARVGPSVGIMVGFPWNEKMQTDLVDIIAEDQESFPAASAHIRM